MVPDGRGDLARQLGGPLVDTRGRVVGLNARGVSMGGQAFTIPSPTILEVLPLALFDRYGVTPWPGCARARWSPKSTADR